MKTSGMKACASPAMAARYCLDAAPSRASPWLPSWHALTASKVDAAQPSAAADASVSFALSMHATNVTASATLIGSMAQTVHFSHSQSVSWTQAPSGSLMAGHGFEKFVLRSAPKSAYSLV